MHIIDSIDKVREIKNLNISSSILTIGNFEGVHLGHQALLRHIVEIAKKEKLTSIVLTFSNHPSEILRPCDSLHYLTTLDHKLKIFKELGIDLVITLPFTEEFSKQTAEEFLLDVRRVIPFYALILGSDAHFGKNREGDSEKVAAIATKLKFHLDYFPDFNYENSRISSSRIRKLIQEGNLKLASILLGRPFSIYGKVISGSSKGALLGFPTANLPVDKLCLPQKGVYSATLKLENNLNIEIYRGIANLGHAPTVNKERDLILEVHLFDKTIDLYDKTVEVELHTFIREEKKFDSIESLKKQIAEDVIVAKNSYQEKNS